MIRFNQEKFEKALLDAKKESDPYDYLHFISSPAYEISNLQNYDEALKLLEELKIEKSGTLYISVVMNFIK